MRGHEWGKGTVKCGLCGIHGHNVTSCPAVNVVYKKYCDQVDKHGENYLPTYAERKARQEIFRKEVATSTSKKKRRKARCSFCNSLKHKRNRCPKLAKFKAKVKKANINWRRFFVSEANRHGFGIGSLVSLPSSLIEPHYTKRHLNDTVVGIIAGFDKNKLNVFCAYHQGGLYSSVPTVDIFTEDKMVKVAVARLKGNWSKELIPTRSSWQFYEVLGVKADSTKTPDEWYEDTKDDESMKWFFSTISIKHRDFPMLTELIQKWTKNDLPNSCPP
jgi:hypothetical protein